MRVFQNRLKWEPITISKNLVEVTEIADQLHYKAAREVLKGKIKYFFMIHASDFQEGLFSEKQYFLSEERTSICVSKFTYDDVYCVTITQKM